MTNEARLAALPAGDSTPDRELVERILAGERRMYAVLMRRYNRRVYRAVRAIVRQDHEAEDIVQHAYVTAYDKLGQFRGESSFGTWLTRMAVNEALGRIRTRGRRVGHLELVDSGEETVVDESQRGPDAETERRELGRVLERYIDELPDNLRVVFMMRDVEELDTAETAACLGLTDEAVRVRLHRARALMRDHLSTVMSAAPDAFRFGAERCDRIVLNVAGKLGL